MAQPNKRSQPSPESASPTLARIAAQSQVDFELEFFEFVLGRNPGFVEGLRVHAKNLALAKRFAEGAEVDRKIIVLCPHDPLAHYNLACSYSLMKQPEKALDTLRKAMELGYRDFKYIKDDRDLDPIRKDPRFRALLREFDKA